MCEHRHQYPTYEAAIEACDRAQRKARKILRVTACPTCGAFLVRRDRASHAKDGNLQWLDYAGSEETAEMLREEGLEVAFDHDGRW